MNGFKNRDSGIVSKELASYLDEFGLLKYPASMSGKSNLLQLPRVALNNGSETIIYTVPAGKKLFLASVLIQDGNGSGFTFNAYVKRGATTYRLNNTFGTVIGTGGGGTLSVVSPVIGMFLEAGEQVAVVVSGAGCFGYLTGTLWDSNVPFFTKWQSVTNVETSLYTVPAGKIAYIHGQLFAGGFFGISQAIALGSLLLFNNGGGAHSVSIKFIPNGEAVDTAHRIGVQTPADNGNGANQNIPVFKMSAGDSISIISTSAVAGVHARMSILELSA